MFGAPTGEYQAQPASDLLAFSPASPAEPETTDSGEVTPPTESAPADEEGDWQREPASAEGAPAAQDTPEPVSSDYAREEELLPWEHSTPAAGTSAWSAMESATEELPVAGADAATAWAGEPGASVEPPSVEPPSVVPPAPEYAASDASWADPEPIAAGEAPGDAEEGSSAWTYPSLDLTESALPGDLYIEQDGGYTLGDVELPPATDSAAAPAADLGEPRPAGYSAPPRGYPAEAAPVYTLEAESEWLASAHAAISPPVAAGGDLASILESVAQRVRSGELPVPGFASHMSEEAALAALLAALLATRR
jgi:hypothetical protein